MNANEVSQQRFGSGNLVALIAAMPARAEQQLERQPVFLFCPHSEQSSAWSLYVEVDKNDPSKPLALGLETLNGQNSKSSSYKGVLQAQKNPGTPRTEIARLEARDFGSGKLEVKENNMLEISVNPNESGLKLTINARVSIDEHFVVGGPEQGKRDMILQYSRVYKCWQAKATTLETSDGRNAVRKYALSLTGIVFVAGATSVSRIAAVDDFGSAILLMDR